MAKPWKLPAVRAEHTLGEVASQILPVRLAETWSRVRAVKQSGSARALHDLRISARRLRYSMEIYAPCFVDEFRGAIQEIKEVQVLLGRLHDRDVALQWLADYHLQRDPAHGVSHAAPRAMARRRHEERALKKIIADYRKERERLYLGFLTHWSGLGRRQLKSRLLKLLEPKAKSI